MNSKQHLIIGFALLALTGCLPGTTDPDTDNDTSSSASSIEETRNVLYRGTLEELGVSIFMQGTHKLTLDDGRSIILESEDIDLDDYLGVSVEVFGSVRPTVEAGGMIMRVESVTSLASSSSTSSSIFCGGIAAFPCPDGMSCIDDPNDSCDPNNGGADCGGICINASSESSAPASAAISSARISSALSSVASSSASTPAASDDITAKAQIMAKSNMDAANWTQKYCSTHMSFCMPVHRNWWFNSFGATASALWHLEIGPSEMNNIGEGPITVRLVSGDVSSSGMTDGQVLMQADGVVGAKAWTNNRHFEVRAPANLEAAVRYIIQNIVASES